MANQYPSTNVFQLNENVSKPALEPRTLVFNYQCSPNRVIWISVARCRDVLIESLNCMDSSIVLFFFDGSSQQLLFVSDSILSRIVCDGRIQAISWSCQSQTQSVYVIFPHWLLLASLAPTPSTQLIKLRWTHEFGIQFR